MLSVAEKELLRCIAAGGCGPVCQEVGGLGPALLRLLELRLAMLQHTISGELDVLLTGRGKALLGEPVKQYMNATAA